MNSVEEFLVTHRSGVQLAWIDAAALELAPVAAALSALDAELGKLAKEPRWAITKGGAKLADLYAPDEASALAFAGELFPRELGLKAERIQE
jgi:hypothetical protein